ncbi:diguanylate cyclase [Sinorhizobium sp. RAC02]|uniref:diguanylate cyclase domain-containing protein n=1 Tax=Sinorhizobium sp. RAC02 TaxID=1842534 RepID=UPI00336C2E68
MIDAARPPVNYSGRIFTVSASIGFAFAEGETPTALFTRADLALYAAKAAGGGTYRGPAARNGPPLPIA